MSNEVTSTRLYVTHVPTPENNMTAIVQAEVAIGDKFFTNFGAASAETTNSNNPVVILDAARQDAVAQVGMPSGMSLSSFSEPKLVADVTPRVALPTSAPKKVYTHDPNKAISDKQLNLVNNLAAKKRYNVEELCQKEYGKSSNLLNSQEANMLIKKLQQ